MSTTRRPSPAILLSAWRHFRADHAFNHAAAVAYFSLLALVPFLYLISLMLGEFLPDAGDLDAAIGVVGAFVPEEVSAALRVVGGRPSRDHGLVLIVVPGFLWMASTAFAALEVAVNVAFGTAASRRFWLSRLKSFMGVSTIVLLLVAAVAVDNARLWLDRHREGLLLPPALSPTTAGLAYLVLLGLSYGAFALFYKVLPRGRVAWRAAALAAGVGVVLWEMARRLFASLLVLSPTFGLMTGALAAVVAFLLWVYVAVLVTLFGAEVAAVLNRSREVGASGSRGGTTP